MSKTIYLQGNLTDSFSQMLWDCSQVTHPLFGSMKKLIPKLGNPLTKEQISNLHDLGIFKDFYMREEYDVWGYICIKPEKHYSNYVFAIGDHENKENNFIYTGLQIINKSLFENKKVTPFSVTEIWDEAIKNKVLYGFESKEHFIHLTDLEIYKKLIKK